jgi:hypothetical protein
MDLVGVRGPPRKLAIGKFLQKYRSDPAVEDDLARFKLGE